MKKKNLLLRIIFLIVATVIIGCVVAAGILSNVRDGTDLDVAILIGIGVGLFFEVILFLATVTFPD